MRPEIRSCLLVLGLALIPGATVVGQGIVAPVCETVLRAAGAQTEEDYGRVVATNGDLVAVASPLDGAAGKYGGSVAVFHYEFGTWIEETVLYPWTGEDLATMGKALAFDGNYLAAGAPGAFDLEGAVFIFRRNIDLESPSPWSVIQVVRPAVPLPREMFGSSVAMSGDLLAVGGPFGAKSGARTGRVILYRWDGRTFAFEQEIRAPEDFSGFGEIIALDGNVLAIGAPELDEGHVFVHRYNGMEWVPAADLRAPSTKFVADFGRSVAVDRERIAVGAPGDSESGFEAGSVYVFESLGITWGLSARLEASDVNPEHRFGTTVALSDGLLLVGTPYDDDGGFDAGAAYLFAFEDGTWMQQRKLLARDPFEFAPYRMAESIAIGARDLVMGSIGAAFVQPINLHPGCDCNGNGQGDWVDVLDGTSNDLDANGVPDECQCPEDLNFDGTIGNEDLVAILAAWGKCLDCPEDLNHDQLVGFSDMLLLFEAWGPCP